MASVFLSYDREDAAKAGLIAQALERAGHSVWWDRHIKVGAQYSREIEEALKHAEAVVVLWSRHSVESAWVRDEAAAGRDSGRLVPVALDKTEPPLGFRQFQTTDLSRWKGRSSAPAFQEILGAVEVLGGGCRQTGADIAHEPSAFRLSLTVVLGAALAAMLIAGLIVWRPLSERSSTPVVAVTAAAPSAEARGMARDLLTRLGSLQATGTDSLKLVGAGGPADAADFIFEVDGDTEDQMATANLVLMGGDDGTLLWSKDFKQPVGKQGDLKQQLAFTAAMVLECAMEASASGGARLSQDTLKLYLNGCSAYSELAGADPSTLVPIFRKVVKDAPRFEGAWAKLLLAGSDPVSGIAKEKDYATLRRHVAEAKQRGIDIGETYAAQATLLPRNDNLGALRLYDEGLEKHPDNAFLHLGRSQRLQSVGRMTEAVESARRARQLEPLSPAAHQAYIFALAYAGNVDVANEQLREAEQIWPGASNIIYARFRFDLRFGDPANAIRLVKAGWSEFNEAGVIAFLTARINPTKANIDRAIAEEMTFHRKVPRFFAGVAQTLGEFGRTEAAYRFLLALGPEAASADAEVLFRPALRVVRHDPRFMQVADLFGLIHYWRKSGEWPDFCFEPDLPYDCKAEAAKLS